MSDFRIRMHDAAADGLFAQWQIAVDRLAREVERDPASAATATARRRWLDLEVSYHAAAALAGRLRAQAEGRRHLRRVA